MMGLLGLIPLVTSLMGAASPLVAALPSILGSPAQGSVLLKIADSAQKIFGTTNPDQIALKIQEDKSKGEQFKAECEAHVEEYKAWLADVQSARGMEVAAMQAGSRVQWIPVIITTMIFLIFGIAFWATVNETIAPTNSTAQQMVGAIIAAFSGAWGYWLGSSRGSEEKTATIRTMATSAASAVSQTAAKVAAVVKDGGEKMFK